MLIGKSRKPPFVDVFQPARGNLKQFRSRWRARSDPVETVRRGEVPFNSLFRLQVLGSLESDGNRLRQSSRLVEYPKNREGPTLIVM